LQVAFQVAFIVFVSAVAIQLLFFFILLIGMRKKQAAGQENKPPVSIVICAHDEEDNLKTLIPTLLAQNYPTFEIVIVNDRSNDDTFDWLIAETRKDHRLRMVHVNRLPEHVTSKKYALTLGIKSATYDVILLTDADCRPESPEWISEMSGQFAPDISFVIGFSPYQRLPGFLNLFIRFETLLAAIQYIGFGLLRMPYMGVGRNLAYRKSFFLEKKGFVNMLRIVGGDDDLFVNRHATKQNAAMSVAPKAKVVSVPKTSWKAFFVQKIRHLSVGRHYTFRFKIILGLFMSSWVITWWLGLTLLVLNTMVVTVAGLLAARCLVLTIVFYNSARRLDEKFEVWTVPVLDFLFSIYYISTGLVALLTKKVRWKN
jgi:glycosyltransferase involved in cell wall biosynthesis